MVGLEESLILLSTFNENELKEFLYSCMDDVCGRKGPVIANLRSNNQLTPSEHKELVTNVKAFCCDSMRLDLNVDKLKEQFSFFSEKQCEIICICLASRKHEITPFIYNDQIRGGGKVLTDYDWKLKWVIGSSAFSALHEPLLSLDLHLRDGKGDSTMNLELDKSELKHLIETLEKAQQSMFSK